MFERQIRLFGPQNENIRRNMSRSLGVQLPLGFVNSAEIHYFCICIQGYAMEHVFRMQNEL